MIRPWLIQLPLAVANDAREELRALYHGLTPAEYVAKVWALRVEEHPVTRRHRSRSWPKSCRTKEGYSLLPPVSNVTTLKRARK